MEYEHTFAKSRKINADKVCDLKEIEKINLKVHV